MKPIKYTSIKSVLFGLSLIIEERYWSELNIMEWATAALRSMNIIPLLEDKVALIEICEHKANLPSDLKFLIHAAYYDTTLPQVTLSENIASAYPFKPMRLNESPFALSICLSKKITTCTECSHWFSISPDMTLTTSAKDGSVLISYKSYPLSEDGSALIPDDEVLKEALLQYVLYKYWLVKYQMKEDGAGERMRFHLSMWDVLSKKVANLNRPSVPELDNLMRIWNRIVPRQNRYDQFFTTLTNQEDAAV